MKVKITKLTGPTHKTLHLKCPGCKFPLTREVLISQKEGKESCGLCCTTFKWEEVE